MMRPVIRLAKPLVYLTQVAPGAPETSMILRPRPYWEELRTYLSGEDVLVPNSGTKPRQRCVAWQSGVWQGAARRGRAAPRACYGCVELRVSCCRGMHGSHRYHISITTHAAGGVCAAAALCMASFR